MWQTDHQLNCRSRCSGASGCRCSFCTAPGIGAGFYVLIGAVAGRAGIYAPWSFVIAATVMALTVASYAKLSTRFPVSAGEAAYVIFCSAYNRPATSGPNDCLMSSASAIGRPVFGSARLTGEAGPREPYWASSARLNAAFAELR